MKHVCKHPRTRLIQLRTSHGAYRWLHGRRKSFFSIFWKSYSEIAKIHFGCSKKAFFFDLDEALYLARRLLSTRRLDKLCIWNMFVNTQGIVWYNLEHHGTYRWLHGRRKSFLSIFWKSYSEIAKHFGVFFDEHFSLETWISAPSRTKSIRDINKRFVLRGGRR